jgi:hypothetical protein
MGIGEWGVGGGWGWGWGWAIGMQMTFSSRFGG